MALTKQEATVKIAALLDEAIKLSKEHDMPFTVVQNAPSEEEAWESSSYDEDDWQSSSSCW